MICSRNHTWRATSTIALAGGWEWPTKDQWDEGQYYGYCWVPA